MSARNHVRRYERAAATPGTHRSSDMALAVCRIVPVAYEGVGS